MYMANFVRKPEGYIQK